MNSRASCDIESGEGFLGGNHVVGCSRIFQVRFRLSEASLQGMAPLMIFCRLSSIRLLYSLRKRNMVMFKEGWQLVDLLLHAPTFRMKASQTIRTLSIFKLFLFIGAQSSFRRLLILFWLWIKGFGSLPLVLPFSLYICWFWHQKRFILGILEYSHLNQIIIFMY